MEAEAEHRDRVRRLGLALSRARLVPGDPFACPYLPQRDARHVVVTTTPLVRGAYHALMDHNFRRLGPVYYRPACEGCRECRMLRVQALDHRPTRAQRRCLARNADLCVTVGRPRVDDEKFDLYQRYLDARHDGRMEGSWEEFTRVLYNAAPDTLEVCYRLAGRLVGVGLADAEPLALSAIYCYFEPGERARSLGVFNVLWLLDECRRRGAPWLYLGYYVAGSRKMAYKADYRPHEVLDVDGNWRA